jgi:hypothetical protein
MPSKADAFHFVQDPATPLDKLRSACEILGLDAGGSEEAVRARLTEHLRALDPVEPVVCLNPAIPAQPGRSGT